MTHTEPLSLVFRGSLLFGMLAVGLWLEYKRPLRTVNRDDGLGCPAHSDMESLEIERGGSLFQSIILPNPFSHWLIVSKIKAYGMNTQVS